MWKRPWDSAEMNVKKKRHIDKGEQDEEGYSDYYYEYDSYEFSDGQITFHARSYTDEDTEAHFLRKVDGKKTLIVSPEDLKTPLFQLAIKHLRLEGKRTLRYLAPDSDVAYKEILL